ncbi:MAG: InlB B-repeat-containing protein, partial [Planctomycetota bacterium]
MSVGVDIGGGMVCADTHATIENSTLSNNIADGVNGSGGAINFYGGYVTHIVKNCLLTGNSATAGGGAISSNVFATPEIMNCTFGNNTAGKLGGAIFCNWSSSTTISDSIFQANNSHAIAEEDFDNSIVKYCLFNDNSDGDYGLYDTVTQQIGTSTGGDLDATNIDGNPLFVAGPLGGFYLSQAAAGQASDSPAINIGSDLASALGLDAYTTRTDDTTDAGVVDIGYHYTDSSSVSQFKLTASVIGGHGRVEPAAGTYYAGTTVALTAIPDNGYRVASWTGTANDTSRAKTNTVVMLSDKDVTVQFDQPRTIVVGSDPNYTTIQRAIDEAADGDIVMLPTGTYTPPSPFGGLRIINKGITLTSENPDDPDGAAATVLEGYGLYIATAQSEAIVDGITFRSSRINIFSCSPTVRNCVFTQCRIVGANGQNGNLSDGIPGVSVEGGAMHIVNGSPTVQNCVFDGCSVDGGNGGRGANGVISPVYHPAGWDGGWAGWAYGGAVYCGFNSSPSFTDCSFTDCTATGGDGGNGGTGYSFPPIAKGGRGGNWVWAPSEEPGPFTVPWWLDGTLTFWDGWQFAPYADPNIVPGISYLWPPSLSRWKDYWKYSGYGGAVFCENESSPKFLRCTFTDSHTFGGVSGMGGISGPVQPGQRYNIENFGGALYACHGSNPELVDCSFTICSADTSFDPRSYNPSDPNDPNSPDDIYVSYGGAVAIEDDCSVKFINCDINDSNACIGGGIWWSESNVTFIDCNLADNTAYHGGALYSVDSTGTVDNST